MGHFRKYYTTVTSLTYAFPPRNTIVGIIAAILGLKRDSYYDLFSRSKSKIGLQILTPIRKVSFSTNYLDTDQLNYRRFRGESIVPTRIQYVMSIDANPLKYRIFLEHEDIKLVETLKNRLREGKIYYPLSLGAANCLAFISDFRDMDTDILNIEDEKEFDIVTVIRQDHIKIDPKKNSGKRIMIEERIPPDFEGDRQPSSKSINYIYEANCKPMTISVKGKIYRIDAEYGTFL